VTYRVVIHMDDDRPERQHLALGNVVNLLNDIGDRSVDVEIVVNGPAISSAAAGSPLRDHFAALHGRGVRLIACANSMKTADMSKKDMATVFEIVPAGISHLVRRQHEGWAYVRP
jgi:intracellular sulfur oxidation DsrE/DsrF family protein